MNIDLSKLKRNLLRAKPEKTVPDDGINTYLLNVLLKRIINGENVTYGEIDYSQFEADDLRMLAGYCERKENVSRRLSNLLADMDRAAAFCRKTRAFC